MSSVSGKLFAYDTVQSVSTFSLNEQSNDTIFVKTQQCVINQI